MGKSLKALEKKVRKKISPDVSLREWRDSIVLEGMVGTWEQLYNAGKICANQGYKGVVNKLKVYDLDIPPAKKPLLTDNFLQDKKVDVLIIGAGIIGCAIARELCKWQLSILLVDKEDDVAMHASSRNDGMIHSGIEPKIGSKKALYNVKGNEMYTRIGQELDVKIIRCGSSVLFDRKLLSLAKPVLDIRAQKMGVKGVTVLSKEEVLRKEPHIGVPVAGALHLASVGITSPYKMTVAYAENAVQNGAEVSLNTIVLAISLPLTGSMIKSITPLDKSPFRLRRTRSISGGLSFIYLLEKRTFSPDLIVTRIFSRTSRERKYRITVLLSAFISIC
jgi:glycerol-3-phosphate dehydrogenase